MEFDVFYDYHCPYVYRLSVLLDSIAASSARPLRVNWRYFSLTQVNSKDDGWTVWGALPTERVRGRLAFAAAEAARRQGRFDDLHMPLLHARHRDGLDLDAIPVVDEIATRAGLDMDRFHKDVEDPSILEALARDHRAAVDEHGVFGTPTIVLPDGAAAYVRLTEAVAGAGAAELFDRLMSIVSSEPRIREIKRPSKPRPQ
jgi:predicted DsbA family dithiol-disulfide isomerase